MHYVVIDYRNDYDASPAAMRATRSGWSAAVRKRENKTGRTMPSVVTKAHLVDAAAKAGQLSKAAAGEAVNAVFNAIVNSVAKGNRVTVVGFGTFLPRRRKARAGRSPANGKEIKIQAKTIPAFSAGQGFKDKVSSR